MEKAIFKFNGGLGALLCSSCRAIMRTAKDFSEEELKGIRGELDYELPPQYCDVCKNPSPKQKAQQLYTRAYSRWCFELSHEKNYITAKDIAINICNEVLGHMGADRGYAFWSEIRDILRESSHNDLYI